ncbi:hypothetical protein ILUMI_08013 [Ignelater luminosus]|uniref:Amine oxidase domain-containing protein n=1 Tax=Ignelater luminosus TaxID=2038154 RepID=A0A8K0D7N3_IGNLU|nr:hypothetical protein ILUMI_08013 [Ignelater luminosus]
MFTMKIVLLTLLQLFVFTRCENEPKIIIIGAGPAGIAAASKLYQNNITNVKILEAENRIGGRIHSVKFGDAIVDLGAEWYSGGDDTDVYETIKESNLTEPTCFTQIFYHSSGKRIDHGIITELLNIFEEIQQVAVEAKEGVTVEDHIKEKYSAKIRERYKDNSEMLEFASDFLEVIRKEVTILHGAFSWGDVSAKSDHEEPAENNWLNWKGRGFKTILDVLMQNCPDPSKELPLEIILNKEVKIITWDDDEVTVECFDGSSYKADHVIVTVSLGVLKNRYQTLFNPELPENKKNAIEELGIAAVAKIFFYFPTRWWLQADLKSIGLFWTELDQVEFLQQFGTDKHWLLDLPIFYPVTNNPSVLEAFLGGKSVPQIELLSDDEIIDGIMLVLNKFVGNEFKNITKPTEILRYNWYSNPHFRGTYSYQTIQSRRRKVSAETALSEPLTGKNRKMTLLFAGEATNPTHYGSVYGALETGYREAQRLLDIYKTV